MALSAEREAVLARVCEGCGHEFRTHHGPGGPCLAGYVGEDGRPRAAVCPCVCFTHSARPGAALTTGPAASAGEAPGEAGKATGTSAPPRSKPRPRGRKPDSDQRPPCRVKGCKDPATVVVVKDGKPYCRGHGLAEALRLPRSEIRPLGEPLAEAWRAA